MHQELFLGVTVRLMQELPGRGAEGTTPLPCGGWGYAAPRTGPEPGQEKPRPGLSRSRQFPVTEAPPGGTVVLLGLAPPRGRAGRSAVPSEERRARP